MTVQSESDSSEWLDANKICRDIPRSPLGGKQV
jgi:hypothetical protein